MKSRYAGGLRLNQVKLVVSASYTLLTLILLYGVTTARGELVAAWGNNTYGQTQLPEGLDDVIAVAGGFGHNLALKSDGTVVSWGNYPNSQTNIPPASLPFVTAIAAGANHSLALTASGTVSAWGDNTYGQTNVPSDLSNVRAIAGGYYASVALQWDGSVVVWGNDPYGATNVPVGLSNVVAIASGESHVLALKSDGTVVAWGRNVEGETNVPPGLSNVVSIGAGATHSLAILFDGSVIGWGDNSAGQLDIPPGLSNVVSVAGGEAQSLALQTDGTVVAWGVSDGSTNYGQGVVPVGLSNVTAIAAGYWCNLALTFEGPIEIEQDPQSQTVASGSNVTFSVTAVGAPPLSYQWVVNGGPLVDSDVFSGSATATLSIANSQVGDRGIYAVLVSNAFGSVLSAGAVLNIIAPPLVTAQPTNQSAIFFGSAIFSVTAYSSLPVSYQWVFNGDPLAGETNADLILGPLTCAQSGYYNVIIRSAAGAVSSSKAQLTVYQAIVSTSGSSELQDFLLQFTNVQEVAAGSGTVYALLSGGTVAGYIPFVSPDSEVPPGLSDVVAISSSEGDTLALKSDGTISAWGFGGPSLTNVPGALTDIIAVAAGYDYNIALRSNGTVAAWGELTLPAPPLSGLSNVVAIAQGDGRILVLEADGTVFKSSGEGPPQLVPGLSNVIAITMGQINSESLALKADGTVVGWDGFATNPLPDVSNVVALAADSYDVLALKSDGTLAMSDPDLTFPFALSNVFGIDSLDNGFVALLNDGSPVLTVQPGNQILTDGGTIWLHARAVGVQPMNYQWQLNGTDILNATNADLTITNAQGNDSGQYCGMASNSVGSIASRLASVTISSGPPIASPYTLAQALNATNLTWTTFGNAAWFSEVTNSHDGIAAAQSGAISNSMSSGLETTVIGPGTLTFWWMVSSEEYFDFLSFYIDGTNYAARISGEVDWQQETFLIGSGSHTLRWIYAKDPDVSVGQDAGWLDQVSFTPPLLPAELGAPSLLADGSLQFGVFTTNGTELAPSNLASVVFEASSNLIDWIPLTNTPILTDDSVQLRDPDATNSAVRFYRLMKK
jgi:alpha-tubulin suppressor-like RCC1 family protein